MSLSIPPRTVPSTSHSSFAMPWAFFLHARPVLVDKDNAREGRICLCLLGAYRELRRPDIFIHSAPAWHRLKILQRVLPARTTQTYLKIPGERGRTCPSHRWWNWGSDKLSLALDHKLVSSRVKKGVQISRFKIPNSFFNIHYLCLSHPVSFIIF